MIYELPPFPFWHCHGTTFWVNSGNNLTPRWIYENPCFTRVKHNFFKVLRVSFLDLFSSMGWTCVRNRFWNPFCLDFDLRLAPLWSQNHLCSCLVFQSFFRLPFFFSDQSCQLTWEATRERGEPGSSQEALQNTLQEALREALRRLSRTPGSSPGALRRLQKASPSSLEAPGEPDQSWKGNLMNSYVFFCKSDATDQKRRRVAKATCTKYRACAQKLSAEFRSLASVGPRPVIPRPLEPLQINLFGEFYQTPKWYVRSIRILLKRYLCK